MKCPLFRRQHFQRHFIEWKLLHFGPNKTEVRSQGFNWPLVIIGFDNSLVPNMRQAIIWIKAGIVQWCICVTQTQLIHGSQQATYATIRSMK